MPIDESVAHLELVVGYGIVLRQPGREQPIPMSEDAAEQMCAELDARGEHAEAARHRQTLRNLQALARRLAQHADGTSAASQARAR